MFVIDSPDEDRTFQSANECSEHAAGQRSRDRWPGWPRIPARSAVTRQRLTGHLTRRELEVPEPAAASAGAARIEDQLLVRICDDANSDRHPTLAMWHF